MDKPLKILIAEDSVIFSQGLQQLLLQSPEKISAVFVAQEYLETLVRLSETDIDILILDLNFESTHFDGFTIARKVKENYPLVKIIVLTQQAKIDSYEILFSEIGVQGYLDKKLGVGETLEAIETVAEGNTYADKNIKAMLEIGRWMEISKREKEIVELLAQGLTQKEIADKLYISIRTVETHIKNCTQKLDARNTVNLISIYVSYKNANREGAL